MRLIKLYTTFILISFTHSILFNFASANNNDPTTKQNNLEQYHNRTKSFPSNSSIDYTNLEDIIVVKKDTKTLSNDIDVISGDIIITGTLIIECNINLITGSIILEEGGTLIIRNSTINQINGGITSRPNSRITISNSTITTTGNIVLKGNKVLNIDDSSITSTNGGFELEPGSEAYITNDSKIIVKNDISVKANQGLFIDDSMIITTDESFILQSGSKLDMKNESVIAAILGKFNNQTNTKHITHDYTGNIIDADIVPNKGKPEDFNPLEVTKKTDDWIDLLKPAELPSQVELTVSPDMLCESVDTDFTLTLNFNKIPKGYNCYITDQDDNPITQLVLDKQTETVSITSGQMTNIDFIVFHVRHDYGLGNGEDDATVQLKVHKKVATRPIQLITS